MELDDRFLLRRELTGDAVLSLSAFDSGRSAGFVFVLVEDNNFLGALFSTGAALLSSARPSSCSLASSASAATLLFFTTDSDS